MVKKIFLICLAILLSIQGAASAKNADPPEEKRTNIAIEITDTSRHSELGTAENLENFLIEKLSEKNLVNILDTKIFDEVISETEVASAGELIPVEDLILDEEIPAEKSSVSNLGELLVFDAVELPAPSDTPENFEQNFYKNLGADYVIRCEVLALGLTKVEDKTLSTIFGAAGTLTSLIGSGSGSTNKTLRRIGTGIGLGGFIQTKRTALNTVVNMQFISVETGKILWQQHFTGQGIKHHNPDKEYIDVWEQAYFESVEKTAQLISKRVNKYVDKVIIQGKSDKDFQPKISSIGALVGGKLF